MSAAQQQLELKRFVKSRPILTLITPMNSPNNQCFSPGCGRVPAAVGKEHAGANQAAGHRLLGSGPPPAAQDVGGAPANAGAGAIRGVCAAAQGLHKGCWPGCRQAAEWSALHSCGSVKGRWLLRLRHHMTGRGPSQHPPKASISLLC